MSPFKIDMSDVGEGFDPIPEYLNKLNIIHLLEQHVAWIVCNAGSRMITRHAKEHFISGSVEQVRSRMQFETDCYSVFTSKV